MKKSFIIQLLLILLVFQGCAGINLSLNGDVKEFAAKTASKHLAYEIAKENPELIDKGILYADTLIDSGSGFDYLFFLALDHIEKEVDNPVLRSDYNDLLGLIRIDSDIDIGKAKIVVQGFREGLILRRDEINGS